METCLLLSARRYDFKSTDGKQVTGTKLVYLTGENEHSPNLLGMLPIEITGPIALFSDLGVNPVPAFYDLDFKQRPGKDGKPTLQCTGLKFSAPLAVPLELPKGA